MDFPRATSASIKVSGCEGWIYVSDCCLHTDWFNIFPLPAPSLSVHLSVCHLIISLFFNVLLYTNPRVCVWIIVTMFVWVTADCRPPAGIVFPALARILMLHLVSALPWVGRQAEPPPLTDSRRTVTAAALLLIKILPCYLFIIHGSVLQLMLRQEVCRQMEDHVGSRVLLWLRLWAAGIMFSLFSQETAHGEDYIGSWKVFYFISVCFTFVFL